MITFSAKRIGNKLIPHLADSELEFDQIPGEGKIVKVRVTLPRSIEHHRFLFAAIAEAYNNWPEKAEFQPQNVEHLRAYLICKSHNDYREALATFDMKTMNFKELVEAFGISAAQRKICFPIVDYERGKLYIVAPKSISWDKMEQSDFNTLSSYISEVLKEETGLTLEEYKKNATDEKTWGASA